MGSCLSKKTTICSSPSALPEPPDQTKKLLQIQVPEQKKSEEETVKKEIFLIKHRKSHDTDRCRSDDEKPKSDPKPTSTTTTTSTNTTSKIDTSEAADGNINLVNGGLPSGGIVVRTSSCSKEEIDAILIQCGRLSRSSSTGKAAGSGGGRKYSGSKRSYDFDREIEEGNGDDGVIGGGGGRDEAAAERVHRHGHRHRERESKPSSSSGRRRTPSRERDQQQRSGSRERGGSGGSGGRRVSRSPARRSESPSTANSGGSNGGGCGGGGRPGKMVSVPATVSSMAMDKSNNGGGGAEPPSAATVKRISVKRNAGDVVAAAVGSRSGASPRSRSRANLRAASENQSGHHQQPPSLSRSNSRKAEQSPCRRNPLAEIDQNCILSEAQTQKPNTEAIKSNKITVVGTDGKTTSNNVAVTVVVSSGEIPKPQAITRSRSSRLSRDLDIINPETTQLNPSPSSYTALLLEDIQNFHHKTTISLPACVSKACSIVEAVADLNSSTISNISGDERRKIPMRLETKDPVVESEVVGSDDLMEPSFHKYVTVSRGTVGIGSGGGGDMEELEIESSGSNSFVGGQPNWVSSSSWEPNSADSVDFWTSREDEKTPLPGFKKRVVKERESDRQRTGIGRGRVGSGRSLYSTPAVTAAST